MKYVPKVLGIFFICLHIHTYAQEMPLGQEVIKKCIEYHDPQSQWPSFEGKILSQSIRPNGKDRVDVIELKNADRYFKLKRSLDKTEIAMGVKGDACFAEVNGNPQLTSDQIEQFDLGCDRILRLRNYYLYMYGLPMKLNDPGTLIDEKVEFESFEGGLTYRVKVSYDQSIGSDIWFFYVNPVNYELLGCRFYHDDSYSDGEYITMNDVTEIKQMKLPKIRKWYMNADDKYLGSDEVLGEVLGNGN